MIADTNMTMTENEINLLKSLLEKSSFYLEYGSGFSTKLALKYSNLKTIYVIESNNQFLQNELLPLPQIQQELNKRLIINYIDIGEIGGWGYPMNNIKSFLYPCYTLFPLHSAIDFDLILIDGVFRGACALFSLIYFPKAEIVIHDFMGRKRYHYLLRFADIKTNADSMVVLTRKKNFNEKKATAKLKKQLYQPEDAVWHRKLRNKLYFK